MITNTPSLVGFLAKTRPFSGASRADVEALAAVCSEHLFSSGECVFQEGERATSGWLVRDGRVRILDVVSRSRQSQIELLGPGELFGFFCRLGEENSTYPCTAVAEGPLAAVRIPDQPFAALRRHNPAAAQCTLECAASRILAMRREINYGRENAGARVARTLLVLHARFGDDIPITRHALSVWVGSAQETVFRVLARLRSKRLVSTGRGRVRILDSKGLEKFGAKQLHL